MKDSVEDTENKGEAIFPNTEQNCKKMENLTQDIQYVSHQSSRRTN